MIERAIQPVLKQLLARFPAVALLGPRQVGKTTLALSLASELKQRSVYLDLERPSDRVKLSDPELYLEQHEDRLVILDEIHRLPGIFKVLRGLIDRRRRQGIRSGQFLLLGSASIDLLQQSSETLAGRIAYQELRPFSELEIAAVGSKDQLWVRGGFPESFVARSDEELRMARRLHPDLPGEGCARSWPADSGRNT
jgi:predicted AAA+ superfamily ATPase